MKTASSASVTPLATVQPQSEPQPQSVIPEDFSDSFESSEFVSQAPQQDRFIRIMTVLDRVGIARSTLYTYMESGLFPAQIKIDRASYWSESEINAWMEHHKAHSRFTGES
jgi:prophage regulatory protein